MNNQGQKRRATTVLQLAGLFCLFFLISWGLGYPILNRYDPGKIPGLTDVSSYAATVVGAKIPGPEHLRFRILVPWIAKPFYHLALGRFGSWNPVTFGLLVADSLFVAATAVLVVVLGSRRLGSYPVSLVASLLYLLNFCVPNTRLVGTVDAGEGFFLLALLWSLSEVKLSILPVIIVCGTLTKESFILFTLVFVGTWWVVVYKTLDSPRRRLVWVAISWLFGLLALVGLQRSISGRFVNPVEFGAMLHRNHEYLGHFASSLGDRNLWYIFLWLLPMGIPGLGRLPKSWLIPTGATAAMAFVLDGYYGGAPGTVGRALFSIVGPVLALSSALFLLDDKHERTL
jgi:hypothetical protein